MKLEGEQTLLRIHLRNTDRHGWKSAAEAIVEAARADGLAGATVLEGTFGLDATGQLLQRSSWSLVERVPVVVEIVDAPRKIGEFLTTLDHILAEGLATLERAHVLVYRRRAADASRAAATLHVPAPIAVLSTLPSAEEFPAMQLSEDGQLVRVFIGESDVWEGQPLYKAIVLKAREMGLAGATVLHGTMGFGATSRVHTSKLLELSTDLPILVEIVDSADKIQTLLPFLDACVQEGLITLESVRILKYRHDRHPASG